VAAAALVKYVVSDFKLNFRQLNLLMGIKGGDMMKYLTAAAANRRLNWHGLCGIKQLLTMPGVALLAAALSLAFFLFALGFLKWPISRRRLVGVLGISVNPLLQFLGASLQL
jgi:hypothetical protein